MKLIDLTGRRFGKLTVLSRSENQGLHTRWKCICDCGNIKEVIGSHLQSGSIVSCGCQSKERISKLNYRHGKSRTRLYNIWCGMKSRCCDVNCASFPKYGGRGIKICDEWFSDFIAFHDWALKNGYSSNLTIDRIDVNGDYSPENCRWETPKNQSNNTRRTILISYLGETMSIKNLSEQLGINYHRLYKAIQIYQMDIDDAIKFASGTERYRIKKE